MESVMEKEMESIMEKEMESVMESVMESERFKLKQYLLPDEK